MTEQPIERFTPNPQWDAADGIWAEMAPFDEGDWVRFTDYEALILNEWKEETARKQAETEREAIAEEANRLAAIGTELQDERDEAEAQRDRANEALEEAEQRAANWKRRAESADRGRDQARKQRDEELRGRLTTAAMKDKMFEEAIKHLSFESPEHQEEYVWSLVDGVAQVVADAIFEEGDDD